MENWICSKEFETAVPLDLLHKEHAAAADHRPGLGVRNHHSLFRKKLVIDLWKPPYTINITGDDYYKLYINGHYVGQGPAPSYAFDYHYNTYDISEVLQAGENVIAVHCYYQGLVNRVWNSGDDRQGIYAAVYQNGNRIAVTDANWKVCRLMSFDEAAPAIGYDTQFTENIDMRNAQHGWETLDFDDSGWENACVKADDDHILTEQVTPPVAVGEAFPKSVTRREDGYLFDFGRELAGMLRLEIDGRCGGTVRVMCAEELGESGAPMFEMRCNVTYDEVWTLSGKHDMIENFDYKAFRYALVQTTEPAFAPDQFRVLERHYPLMKRAKFRTDDERLRQVWDICENTVIVASQESFLDCPTREKGQYLGDMTVTAPAHAYISGDARLYQKALRDFANSSNICKGLMAVAPGSFMQEIADFSLLYPLQLLHYYHLSGDFKTLKELAATAEGVVDYFSGYRRADGLLESVTDKWNLVDWPENLRDDYDFALTKPVGEGCHAVINAYYYGAVQAVDEIRSLLGKPESGRREALKEAFFKAFWDEKTGLFKDQEASCHSSLHANALPLFFEMADRDQAQSVIDLIVEKRLCCGVFFSYFVLKGLARYGRTDLVYEMITSTEENSWMNMVREGATACFEAWGKDKKWNTSLCHPWASAPILLIVEDLLGITFEAGEPRRGKSFFAEMGIAAEVQIFLNKTEADA